MVPTPPSSLIPGPASAARSGAEELRVKLANSPSGAELTAGDVDADSNSAESVGDEAPGGDNPTPDQDVVDEIGRALGVSTTTTRSCRAATRSPGAIGIAGSWIRRRRTTSTSGSRAAGRGARPGASSVTDSADGCAGPTVCGAAATEPPS